MNELGQERRQSVSAPARVLLSLPGNLSRERERLYPTVKLISEKIVSVKRKVKKKETNYHYELKRTSWYIK